MSAVELVDTEEHCRQVCQDVLQQDEVAVDIEGVDLSRHGEICVMQIAKRTGPVFLIDITTLGETAFSFGLRDVLESEQLAKLFFDCTCDADALYHLWHVLPRHVLDMQVLHEKATGNRNDRVRGLAKVLPQFLHPSGLEEAGRVKEAGLALFAPEKGGSYEVWKTRPLAWALQKYCAQDVQHLFMMKDRWSSCLSTNLRAVSERRMLRQARDACFTKGPHRSLKDFAFTDDRLTLPDYSAIVEADDPETKRRRL
mmetsp:Transcript_57433/g.134476  ORF Transcript_57433/g.134476 Transcript_57433/m.134476 type:complete len:255 (+) Transcript_57433:50-814(+)